MQPFCFCPMQQLTAEDATFLSENATATLSQFEKVTPNLGEIHFQINITASHRVCCFAPPTKQYIFVSLSSGSEDKILALASSGVRTNK